MKKCRVMLVSSTDKDLVGTQVKGLYAYEPKEGESFVVDGYKVYYIKEIKQNTKEYCLFETDNGNVFILERTDEL